MLILSWNVAGLSSTVHRIHSNYNINHDDQHHQHHHHHHRNSTNAPPQVGNDDDDDGDDDVVIDPMDKKRSRCSSVLSSPGRRNHRPSPSPPLSSSSSSAEHFLSSFFQRHNADIICIQEHKLPLLQLQNRTEPFHCASLHHPTKMSSSRTRTSTTSLMTRTTDNNNNNHKEHKNDYHYYYESFWSCCTDSKSKGLNGVVTYVKCQKHRPTSTTNGTENNDDTNSSGSDNNTTTPWETTIVSANGVTCFSPDSELNPLGRCVITDHGPSTPTHHHHSTSITSSTTTGFVLFNVYVPCGSSTTASIQRKMKFLHALRQCMQQQRQLKQKPVILVGDLNISYNKYDIPYQHRIVCINELIREVQQQQQCPFQQSQSTSIPPWKIDIVTFWPTILHIINHTKRVIPTTTTNSITGEKYSKFRCRVTIVDHENKERHIYLGSHECNADDCLDLYTFTERTYYDEDTKTTKVFQEENTPSVRILVELMNKLIFPYHSDVKVWDDRTVRDIADTVGTVNHHSPSRQWLQSILEEDHMIDTFRHYYPTALGRFTCWNQSLNCRYTNEGSRIDYTIIDGSLLPYLQKGNVTTLRCGASIDAKGVRDTVGNTSNENVAFALSEEGAMSAITANGQFQPAPFDGNGIIEADRTILDTQFGDGQPHTGHVYTPPTFSDHIGVSLLLHDSVVTPVPIDQVRHPVTLLWNDTTTRKSQPHKHQPTISTFFQNRTATTTTTSSSSPPLHRNETKNKNANHRLFSNSPTKNDINDIDSSSRLSTFSTTAVDFINQNKKQRSNQIHKPRRKAQPRPTPPNSVLHHFSRKTDPK